jgi:multidrug efflux pump
VLSRFFISRPIFASVLSIVITLAGGVALFTLPIAQYPPIVPPTIQVQCSYPGASAQVVAESVAAPIEQFVNGVQDMLYMSSSCSNDGSYKLAVTFKPGVELNFAQVLVQNRVNLALPLLPAVVNQVGVTTRKRSPDILMIVTLTSPDNRYSRLYLSNYNLIHLKDELSRVDGVGDVIPFGTENYSMRIWVDPERLAAMGLNASDVTNAVREQNAQVACGQIGQAPIRKGQQTQITLSTLGRLKEPEQFAEIIVKRGADGRLVRIKDIGRVELGPQNEDLEEELDGRPCANMGIFQLPYANALETADRVRAKMKDLAASFPQGVRYDLCFDTTPFIRDSIDEVVRTLFAAVVLVAIVVLVFLQSWRSAIIPLVAVPVAIIGTFAVMAAVGFSLNNLTLFGLVLAIGIVVDDAIVVVEAVEHHIEEGMSPHDATVQAMREVSGPVIAVALVLTAVFMPCTFISGITGSFFKQFAVTVSVSTVISAFNSLTLSPALAAILLKPIDAKKDLPARALDFTFGWFFHLFNWSFTRATNAYLRIVGMMLRSSVIVLVLYGGLLLLTQWGFNRMPTGYLPNQDKGYLLISVQLPDAASVERTSAAVRHIRALVESTEKDCIDHIITISGMSFTLNVAAPNAGQFFIMFKPFDQRQDPKYYYEAVKERLTKLIAEQVPEAKAMLFGPPPLQGLGNASGFRIMVEDRGDLGLNVLEKETKHLVAVAAPAPPAAHPAGAGSAGGKQPDAASAATSAAVKPAVKPAVAEQSSKADPPKPPVSDEEQRLIDIAHKKLRSTFTIFSVNYPQLFAEPDRDQCQAMGLNMSDVNGTLQSYLSAQYINDFNRFDHTWEVIVEADARFRNRVDDVRRLEVRNSYGKMVPLGSTDSIRLTSGPLVVTRYNLYPASTIQGDWPPGVSSGEAISALENLSDAVLPKKMKCEWTEITFLQLIAENTGMIIFTLAVLLVFLVLAAQYESWSLPLAIIMVVPMCILSAIIGVWIKHSDINIFTQIGFVVLVGLACKNAVLIVEFAKHKREHGMSRREATLEACRLRLRPILMTSFAFILGVVPLVWSTGAGFEMRRALGVAVFSGMLGVTFFGIFLTPVFFSVIDWVGTTPALHSHMAHKINHVLLGVFALGYVRQFGRWTRRTVGAKGERLGARAEGRGARGEERRHGRNGVAADAPIAIADGNGSEQSAQNGHFAPIGQTGHATAHAPASGTNGHPSNGHPSNGQSSNGHSSNGNDSHQAQRNGEATNGHPDPFSDVDPDPDPDPTAS